MHLGIYLILSFVAIFFIAVSYFVKKEIFRSLVFIPSAIIAIYCIGTFIGTAACELERLNYNAWYSESTERLIDTVIEKLENGQQEQVIKELNVLKSKIGWRYEVRGHYDEHVRETIKNLESGETKTIEHLPNN